VRVVDADHADGRRSISLVRLVQVWPDYTLLDVTIKTGRTHQIRVHLAHLGHPVAGDPKYGDFERNRALARGKSVAGQRFGRMFLHARRLRFEHPASGEVIELEAPLPAECGALIAALDANTSSPVQRYLQRCPNTAPPSTGSATATFSPAATAEPVWRFDGGANVAASSSHVVLSRCRTRVVDPEAFVASLASCHMLWFLDIAARRGQRVESYADDAVGVLARNAEGRLAMTEVTLRPRVVFAEPAPAREAIDALHHAAHEACFLAASVRTRIRVEPVHD
jgi:organic hydroperoxide reductase OsmC/OhrA